MTKGIEVLAKRLFSFTIIVFRMKLLVILFVRKKSEYYLVNIFGSLYTRNQIYFLRTVF